MKANETVSIVGLVVVGVVILCLAYVIVVALQRPDGNILARITWKGFVDFALKIVGAKQSKAKPARSLKAGIPASPTTPRSWFSFQRRTTLIAFLVVLIAAVPLFWWVEQPAPWRMLLTAEFNEMFSLLRHSPKEPLNITRGQASLDRVTRMIEMRTDNLTHDHYRNEEIWVVDHYWQYWNTSNLREYLGVNKMFVARGGKIHRMFFLSSEELQAPEVRTLLQAQCQIGRMDADQTGNGFELWRADPKTMQKQEEYEAIARSFRQLPNADRSFDNFDVVQFNDTLYYSSDFSTDYRVMGSSTWIFDPSQVSKIDVRPLFKKSVAERISCDQVLPVMNATNKRVHQ